MKYVLCLHVLCTVCTLISICVFKISPLVEYILECNFTNFRHTDSYSDCGNKMFYYREKKKFKFDFNSGAAMQECDLSLD